MEGSRWKSLCKSVELFSKKLGDHDMIGSFVFNDSIKSVS